MKMVLVLTAQLAMRSSLRVKTCESVCLFRILLPQSCKLRQECKRRTSEYHEALKPMLKKERAQQRPPFLLTAETPIEMYVTIAADHTSPDDPDRGVISSFSTEMLVEQNRATTIMDANRF